MSRYTFVGFLPRAPPIIWDADTIKAWTWKFFGGTLETGMLRASLHGCIHGDPAKIFPCPRRRRDSSRIAIRLLVELNAGDRIIG